MSSPNAQSGGTSSGELFLRWRDEHDARAREELILRFLPLARQLAGRYAVSWEPNDDLVQVASLGLVNAVDRFDPHRGTSFTSFAVPTILGELKRYFRDVGWAVHVPRRAQELALRVTQARQQLAARGSSATTQEIAAHLGLGIEDVLEALETSAAHRAISLQSPSGAEAVAGEAFASPDAQLELAEARVSLAAAAKRLSTRERSVLALRFSANLTLRQVADEVGVSRPHASRILQQALDHLRVLTEA